MVGKFLVMKRRRSKFAIPGTIVRLKENASMRLKMRERLVSGFMPAHGVKPETRNLLTIRNGSVRSVWRWRAKIDGLVGGAQLRNSLIDHLSQED